MVRLHLALLPAAALAWSLPAAAPRHRSPTRLAGLRVPVDGGRRSVTLKTHEVSALQRARRLLDAALENETAPADNGTGFNAIVVPSFMHDGARYDATLASLDVLGIRGSLAPLGDGVWSAALRNVQTSIEFAAELACDEAGSDDGWVNWRAHYTVEMLDDSLEELYEELMEASSRLNMASCAHLVLIGADDASWFLHAFLRYMADTLKVRPESTLVALGSRSDSPLAEAVAACMPEQVPGVRYLSIRGSVPIRQQNSSVENGGDDDWAAPQFEDAGGLFDESLSQTEADASGQVMTCVGVSGSDVEECIVGTAGYTGPTHSFLADPTTVARWIVKSLR